MDIRDTQPDVASTDTSSIVANIAGDTLPEPDLSAPDTGGATSSTSKLDTHPPCQCWDPRGPRSQRLTRVIPIPIEVVLPVVKAEVTRAIEATNSIITLLLEDSPIECDDASAWPPSELQGALSVHRTVIATSLEAAAVHITTAPGYVCRKDRKQHNQLFDERYKMLCEVEVELKRGIDDAESLFTARNELVRAERRMQRRRMMQYMVRAASIVTVPFSPFTSAVLTAIDVMVLSFVVGFQEVVLPNATREVRETLERVERLEQDIEHKLEEVKRLRTDLEAIKAKLDEEQQHPTAFRLVELLDKVQGVRKVADATLLAPCEACAPVPPARVVCIRDIVAAFRDVAEALDTPSIVDGSMASMDDAQAEVVDRALAELKKSPQTNSSNQ